MSIETQQLHRALITKDRTLPCARYRSMNEILPTLYLGDCKAILDPITLLSSGVTHVLSLRQSPVYMRHQVNVKHCQIFIDDTEDTWLLDSLNAAMDYIERAMESGGIVLVHCQEGRSRSASVVIAFLMKHFRVSFEEAWGYVRRRRPVAGPNPGFVDQLKIWERRGYW
ncbi:protein-tyrosine phosphatase-like protein [Tuber brumale]|nr:protein-tyrosine phosphatase-like protein [Tuber brumale]